jgi:hypothetical protein
MLEVFDKIKIIAYIVSIITMVLCVYYDGSRIQDYIKPIYIFFGVIATINIGAYFTGKKGMRAKPLFVHSIFFIYGLHTIVVIDVVWFGLDLILPFDLAVLMIVKYLLAPFIVAFICMMIYFVMQKKMPKVLYIFSGNR